MVGTRYLHIDHPDPESLIRIAYAPVGTPYLVDIAGYPAVGVDVEGEDVVAELAG